MAADLPNQRQPDGGNPATITIAGPEAQRDMRWPAYCRRHGAVGGADELVFVGRVEQVRDLLAQPGFNEAEQMQTGHQEGEGHTLFEAVLGTTSRLVGSTLSEAAFRGRYGGAVIAIDRVDERMEGKLGAVHLRAGDALLARGVSVGTRAIRFREAFYRFGESVDDYRLVAHQLGLELPHYFPMSALLGDQVVEPSGNMRWFAGLR